MMSRTKFFSRQNWPTLLGLGLILLLAAFLRLRGLEKLSYFAYDQARDALYIRRILVDHQWRLIGTLSSLAGLYNGPIYYYFMAPFLWLFRYNPIGLDVGLALIGVVTVGLLFYLVYLFTGKKWLASGISLLYAVQPQVVYQSRYAWNPNPTPLFFLLFIWGLFEARRQKQWGWLVALASLAVLLQLHYSTICLLPALAFFIVVNRRRLAFDRYFWWSWLIFFLLMSPLLIFDLRHRFVNTLAVVNYLRFGSTSEVSPPPFWAGLVHKIRFLLVDLTFDTSSAFSSNLALVFVVLFTARLFKKKRWLKPEIFLILTAVFIGLVMASLYRGSFFDYHLTYLYPAGFFLLAFFTNEFLAKMQWGRILFGLLAVVVAYQSFTQVPPVASRPNHGRKLSAVTATIAADLENEAGQPFNLVGVRSGDRHDHNAVDYQYYLEAFYHQKPLDWDVVDYQQAELLYVISHVGRLKPLESHIWEILLFEPRELVATWEPQENVVIYKLRK